MGTALPTIGVSTTYIPTAYYLSSATNTTELPHISAAQVALSSSTLSATPPAPNITTITPGNHSAIVNFTLGLNSGTNIINYMYSLDNGASWDTQRLTAVSNQVTISGLNNGQLYQVKLMSVNALGSTSVASNKVDVTPVALPPPTPTIINIFSGDHTASIEFTAGADTGTAVTDYEYSYNGGAFKSSQSTISPISLTELNNGDLYTIIIKAVSVVNPSTKLLSAPSNSMGVTPAGAPFSPSNIRVTRGNGSATIDFDIGYHNGSPITNYKYSCSTSSTSNNVNYSGSTSNSILISPLTNGTTYYVKLQAVTLKGTSAIQTLGFPVTPMAAPAAPTLTIVSVDDSTATIHISDNATNGAEITHYKYAIGGVDFPPISKASVLSNLGNLVLTELENGKSYTITLKAKNEAGDSSPSSLSNIITAGRPFAPTIDSAEPGNNSVTINFSPHPSTGPSNGSAIITYKHSYSSDSGSTWSAWTPRSTGTTESPLIVSGLTNGQTYKIKLKAVNGKGDSVEASNESLPKKAGAKPDPPIITRLEPIEGALKIHFNNNANNNGYDIVNYFYSTDNGESWTDTFEDITSPIDVVDLEDGATLPVRLYAVNEMGESDWSDASSVILASAPDAPIIIGVSGEANSVSIAFTAPDSHHSDISMYKVSYITKIQNTWATTWSTPVNRTTGTTASPIRLTGLTNAQFYKVKIQAVNQLGDGPLSLESSQVMPKAPPLAPTITGVNTIAPRSATIAFDGAFYNGSTISTYKYSYSSNNGTSWSTPIQRSSGTTGSPIAVGELDNGKSYIFKILAVNGEGDGTQSASSFPSFPSVMPVDVPGKPTIDSIDLSGVMKYHTDITNGSEIISYRYYIDGVLNSTITPYASPTTTPIKVTGLIDGTPYNLSIDALNSEGYSPISDSYSVTTKSAPAAPIITSIIPESNGLKINFNTVVNNGSAITSYKYSVWNMINPMGPNPILSWLSVNPFPLSVTNQIRIPNLSNTSQYSVRIKAYNKFSGGIEMEGAWSDASLANPKAGKPDAPTGISIAVGDKKAIIRSLTQRVNGATLTNYYYMYTLDGVASEWIQGGAYTTIFTPFDIPNLQNGKNYIVALKVDSDASFSDPSDPVQNVIPIGPAPAPTITDMVKGNRSATIYFTEPENKEGNIIVSYKYQYKSTATNSTFNAYSIPQTPIIDVDTGKLKISIANNLLTNGITYYVNILPVTSTGATGIETTSDKTVTPSTSPAAPSIIEIVDVSNNTTATNLTINLTRPTAANNGGMAISSYEYSCLTSSTSEDWKSCDLPLNSTTDSTLSYIVVSAAPLTIGETYYVRLRAINDASGASSLPKSFIMYAPPAAPTIIDISGGNVSATITFTDGSNNGTTITGYSYNLNNTQIWSNVVPLSSVTSVLNVKSFVVQNLENGTTYYIKIKAITSRYLTEGVPSIYNQPVIPATNPGSPSIIEVTRGNQKITIDFDDPTITGGSALDNTYRYSCTTTLAGEDWKPFTLEPLAARSIEMPELLNGTLYFIKLQAHNIKGYGLSNTPLIKTLPHDKPSNIVVDIVAGANGTTIVIKSITCTSNGSDKDSNGNTIPYIYSYLCSNNNSVTSIISLPCTISGLTKGATYDTTIYVKSQNFDAVASTPISITPLTRPNQMVISSITGGNTTNNNSQNFIINFTDPQNGGAAITGYQYALKPIGTDTLIWLDGQPTTLDPTSPLLKSIEVPGRQNGNSYSAMVRCTNSTSPDPPDSAYSQQSLYVTAIAAVQPYAPTNISMISVTSTTAIIEYTAGASGGNNITGYVYSFNNAAWSTATPVTSLPTTSSPRLSITIPPTGLEYGSSYPLIIAAVDSVYNNNPSTINKRGRSSDTYTIYYILAPSAPTNVTPVGKPFSINITFTPPTNLYGSTIDYYMSACTTTDVQPAANSADWKICDAPVDVVSSTSKQIAVSNLINGTKYYVRLKAITTTNAAGNVLYGPSNTSTPTPSATPIDDLVAPVITDVSRNDPTTGGGCVVSFNIPIYNGVYNITNYFYSINNGSSWPPTQIATATLVSNSSPAAAKLTISGLQNGTSYIIQIKAKNTAYLQGGNPSTSTISITPATLPNPPTAIIATALNNIATITYLPTTSANSGGLSIENYKYAMYVSGASPIFESISPSDAITISSIQNSVNYYIQMKAYTNAGWGTASPQTGPFTFSAQPAGPIIINLAGAATTATITFTSTGVTDIAGYHYSTSTDNSNWSGWTTTNKIAISSLTTVSTNSSGVTYSYKLPAGTLPATSPSYYIRLMAVTTKYTITSTPTGTISTNDPSLVTPVMLLASPGVPNIDDIVPGDSSVTLTITPPSNNGGSPVTSYDYAILTSSTATAQNISSNFILSGHRIIPTTTGSKTTLLIPNLINGTKYNTICIRAVNAAEMFSVKSTKYITAVTPYTAPEPPSFDSTEGVVAVKRVELRTRVWFRFKFPAVKQQPIKTGGYKISGLRYTLTRNSNSATIIGAIDFPLEPQTGYIERTIPEKISLTETYTLQIQAVAAITRLGTTYNILSTNVSTAVFYGGENNPTNI